MVTKVMRGGGASESEDEVDNSFIDDNEVQVVDAESAAGITRLDTIWDSDMVCKSVDEKKGKVWTCFHCNTTHVQHNGTKALYHLAQQKGQNVRPCQGNIDCVKKRQYQDLFCRFLERKSNNTTSKSVMNDSIAETHSEIQQMIPPRKRARKGGSSGSKTTPAIQSGMTSFLSPSTASIDAQSIVSTKRVLNKSFSNSSTKPKGQVQLKISVDCVNPEMSNKMDAAISDWIHSTYQSFNTAEDEKFRVMLNLARNLPSNYVPPHAKAVGGVLLDANYTTTMANAKAKLNMDAGTFGLTFFGDGATIQRNPKMNLLASGIYEPAAVIDVIDCSGHMSAGGKKDASYIASLFLVWFRKFDPKHELIDLVYFDGASNVQLAGEILAKFYPRVTCLHGAEHVVSLVFNDIFQMPPFKMLLKFHNRVRKYCIDVYLSHHI